MSLGTSQDKRFPRRLLALFVTLILGLLIVGGIFARKGWLPSTDSLTGKRTTWFGRPVAKNASSSWNLFAAPLPSPTPQHSKDYIYAGSRLLAVEDANASASPPYDLAVWRPSTGTWWVLGGPGSSQTSYSWGTSGDIPVPTEVKSSYDGLGRTYKTQKTDLSDPAGDVFTYTCFDQMGRVEKSSNPFQNVSSPNCNSTLEWTTPEYDDLSRTKKVTSPDLSDVDITFWKLLARPEDDYGTSCQRYCASWS